MFEYTPPTNPWIDIVYEDEHILAANKPSGLLSVPGKRTEHYDSLWSRLSVKYPEIQVVHRLDMDTSGLMLLAKNKAAESALKKQFQYRLTHKIYYARVWGDPRSDSGEINLPLIGDWPNRPRQKVCLETGKPSITHYNVIKREEQTSVIQLLPVTGRSHQLRVHMMAIGHPIIGDEFYAQEEAQTYSSRLELHAAELSFYHPNTQQLHSIFVPCPFYPEADEQIFKLFKVETKLPDYKKLPHP